MLGEKRGLWGETNRKKAKVGIVKEKKNSKVQYGRGKALTVSI